VNPVRQVSTADGLVSADLWVFWACSEMTHPLREWPRTSGGSDELKDCIVRQRWPRAAISQVASTAERRSL
jgi:hypothetical protein